jgi:energy-coupling factor transporter ATP-binding protein EcfA2
VVVDGGAYLFLGHSTAGKSTIARLLGSIFPVLADDAVLVLGDSEKNWRVVDGGIRFGRDDWNDWPNRLRQRMAADGGTPVNGFMRLHKGAGLQAEPMESLALARCLMDAVFEIDIQRKPVRSRSGAGRGGAEIQQILSLRRQWFQRAAGLARSRPGWNLTFSPRQTSDQWKTFFHRLPRVNGLSGKRHGCRVTEE